MPSGAAAEVLENQQLVVDQFRDTAEANTDITIDRDGHPRLQSTH